MRVADVMTRDVCLLNATRTAPDAARVLRENDIGMIPVAKDDRLMGVVTDCDLVVRVLAEQKNPAEVTLDAIASEPTRYCFEDEDCERVAHNMDALLVRRLPVVSRDKRLVGIVSMENIRPRKPS